MKRDILKWFTATLSLKYHGFSLTNAAAMVFFYTLVCGLILLTFPVRIRVRKLCKALEEDSFRHHYDGPKFRHELSVPETLDLLDLCEQAGSSA